MAEHRALEDPTVDFLRPASVESLDEAGVLRGAVALVVDDGPANVLLLDRLLTRAGLEVVGVTDSREAVERFLAVQPDVVLLDLHMPHLDGVAVLEALAQVIPPDSFTPVIVLTADTTLAAKRRGLLAGAADFVTKPFEQDEVLLRVKSVLRTRHLHQALQRHNQALARTVQAAEREAACIAQERDATVHRVRRVIDTEAIDIVFQPIVELSSGDVVGAEALSRFPSSPLRPPNEWFEEAASVGLGTPLELLAVRRALAQVDMLAPDAYLSVNVSPATALTADLEAVLVASGCAERIVLELTEHAPVDAYTDLLRSLDRLRTMGMRLAVDDAGAGYSSLHHILKLRPNVIKLDISLTAAIDEDPAQRALAAALVTFAGEIGATITAEGVEHERAVAALRRLGVHCGQGYHLGRPAPLPLALVTHAGVAGAD